MTSTGGRRAGVRIGASATPASAPVALHPHVDGPGARKPRPLRSQLVPEVVPGGAAAAGDHPDPQRDERQRQPAVAVEQARRPEARAAARRARAASLPSVNRASSRSITSVSRPVGA